MATPDRILRPGGNITTPKTTAPRKGNANPKPNPNPDANTNPNPDSISNLNSIPNPNLNPNANPNSKPNASPSPKPSPKLSPKPSPKLSPKSNPRSNSSLPPTPSRGHISNEVGRKMLTKSSIDLFVVKPNSSTPLPRLTKSRSLNDASSSSSNSYLQRKIRVAEYGRRGVPKMDPCPLNLVPLPPSDNKPRCKFITAQTDPAYLAYHDEEWGVPVHDDRSLFELLVLSGAQVELSWPTILNKRELYRAAFAQFDPADVARFNERYITALEADPSLLMHNGKVRGFVENAQRILEIVEEFGSLDSYLWSFFNGKPMANNYRYPKQIPAKTSKSETVSKDLVRRGFRFVGPTIMYSFMQAAGMTNDHLVQCFRHKECARLAMPKDRDCIQIMGDFKACIAIDEIAS